MTQTDRRGIVHAAEFSSGLGTRVVTEAGAVTIDNNDLRVIIKKTVAAATTVNLPDLTTWPYGKRLYIKDGANVADTYNITITPSGSQKIDLLSSYSIVSPGGFIWLTPLPDLSGWLTS